MIKTLELECPVSTYDEYTEGPKILKITLNENDVAWINKMSKLVKKQDLHTVTSYSHINDYPHYYVREDEGLVEFEGSTECEQVVVTNGSFYWKGYIKHTEVRYESESFSVKKLNAYFRLMDLPLDKMPRFINDEDEYIQQIAKSRMEKGE